jgi:predicted ArsR family transcriptional regulator
MSEEVTNRVIAYLETHEAATEEDIAKDLNLHMVTVLDVLHTLEKKGVVRPA